MSEVTITRWLILGVIAAGLLSTEAEAVRFSGRNASGSVNVNIKGVIMRPPPCTINNNQTIDVDFGNAVDISKVDGKHYLKTIPYTLQCSGNTSNGMKLSIKGSPAGFDDGAALEAGHGGLGIELQHDGVKLALNKTVNFTWPDLPVLQAVPVKKSGATLDTGQFSVGATMVVEWQ